MVLKPGKSKLKVLTDSVPDENPLPGSQRDEFFLYPHMVGAWGWSDGDRKGDGAGKWGEKERTQERDRRGRGGREALWSPLVMALIL